MKNTAEHIVAAAEISWQLQILDVIGVKAYDLVAFAHQARVGGGDRAINIIFSD